MKEVIVGPISVERLAAILPDERAARLAAAVERARTAFGDRVVWHVNATAHGGGVAEMLQTLLAYGNAAGVDVHFHARHFGETGKTSGSKTSFTRDDHPATGRA